MWTKLSDLLRPLTALAPKKVKLKLTVVKQKAFNKIKQIVYRGTLSIYTDFNKRSDIHTNASEF